MFQVIDVVERLQEAHFLVKLLMRTFSPCPGQRFGPLPSSATVAEGGSAEFSCTVLSNDPNPTRIDSVWGVQAPGGTELFLGAGTSVLSFMNGSTASVGTPFNSPLTIANITQSLDGTRVRCFSLVGANLTFQPEPYAFLTVQCKLFWKYVHDSITCSERSYALRPCKFDLECTVGTLSIV